MQCIRFIDIRSFFFDDKILFESFKELCGSQSVKVFHYTVIINDSQLIGRETHSHEIIILFVTMMVRILFCLLSTYQCSSGRTMMTIGDIKCRHFGKFCCDRSNISCLVHNPESMSETITGSYKIIYRLLRSIFLDYCIQNSIIRIGKEHRFYVGIIYANMLHTVFLFITTGQLMLFNDAIHIIRNVGTYHQTILCFTIHRLGIDVVILFVILYQPTLILK